MGHARDSLYAARDDRDVIRLLQGQPFGWLVSPGGDDAAFTPLPLRAECNAEGHLVALRGHVARRNPHVARLQRVPRAYALVIGPQAYLSPGWLDDRSQAPTWNYTAAAFTVDVACSNDLGDIRDELDALVTSMEAGREAPWSLAELGDRFAELAKGVTALHAPIVDTQATFKLGQDESPHDLTRMLAGLDGSGEHALADWMRDFRRTRDPRASD